MQEILSSQKNIIIVVAGFLLVLGGGYYYFSSQSNLTGGGSFDKNLLDKKVSKFLSVKDSLDFKNASFLKSPFYPELVNNTENIPLIKARGRDNPFIPYAATGPAR